MSADIGRISTGQNPTPVAPARSAPAHQPAAPIAVPPPAIVVPSNTSGGASGGLRKIVYVVGGLVIIGLVYAIVSLISKDSTTVVQISPTPSPSASPTPATKSLSSYFRQTGASVELKADGTPATDFANAVSTSQISLQQASRLSISGPFSSSLSEFLGALAVPTASLNQTLASDWAVLVYGQKEQFDASGKALASTTPQARIALISEVRDVSAANQAMLGMEKDLAVSAAKPFGYDVSKALVPEFSSGTYRQIPIRYRNFPYADRSIDYGIILASNGKNYLIIANSRESIFFAIDQLMQ
jgi:hypothetical protein